MVERTETVELENTGDVLRVSGNLLAGVDRSRSRLRTTELYPLRAEAELSSDAEVIDLSVRDGYATTVTGDGWMRWRGNSGERDAGGDEEFSEETEIISTRRGEVFVDPLRNVLRALDASGRYRTMEVEEDGFNIEPRTVCVDENEGRLFYIDAENSGVYSLSLSGVFEGFGTDILNLGTVELPENAGFDFSMASVGESLYLSSASDEGSSLTKIEHDGGGIEVVDSQGVSGMRLEGRPVTNGETTAVSAGDVLMLYDTRQDVSPLHEVGIGAEIRNVEILGSGSETKVFVYTDGTTYEVNPETGEKNEMDGVVYVDGFRTVRNADGTTVVEYGAPEFRLRREEDTFAVENGDRACRYLLRLVDESETEITYDEDITPRLGPGESYGGSVQEIFDRSAGTEEQTGNETEGERR
jgi:hypothetical protein